MDLILTAAPGPHIEPAAQKRKRRGGTGGRFPTQTQECFSPVQRQKEKLQQVNEKLREEVTLGQQQELTGSLLVSPVTQDGHTPPARNNHVTHRKEKCDQKACENINAGVLEHSERRSRCH